METQGEVFGNRVTGAALVVPLFLLAMVLGGGSSYLVLTGYDEAPIVRTECDTYRTVEVAVVPVLHGVVTQALDETTPECTRVDVSMRTGGEVALNVSMGGRLPDVWIADSGFWMTPRYLGSAPGLRLLSSSVARTPLLLVGGPAARRFPSWGDAEGSGFVSVPDPLTSTVGSLAVVAPQAEASQLGRAMADAREMVVPFAQEYGARRSRGLDDDIGPAWLREGSPRLVVATEQELVKAQGQSPFLRDLTPSVGSPVLDFPVAVSQRAAPGSGLVARNIVRHLADDDGLEALRAEGFREPLAQPGEGPATYVSTFLPTPGPSDIASTVQSWRTLSVPSAILAVVDTSGSMDYGTANGTRVELLADAAKIGLSFLPDHARVGLWIFSIDKGGPGQDWRVLEPMRRLEDLRFGRTQRSTLRARAEQLPALTDGGTGLYDTALAAYKQAQRDYRPHYSNAVVLMTDGANEDPGSIRLGKLVSRLRELRNPLRPVRIVGIAISKDADLGALERMAEATGGDAYLAEQPEDILGVFAQAVLSR